MRLILDKNLWEYGNINKTLNFVKIQKKISFPKTMFKLFLQ